MAHDQTIETPWGRSVAVTEVCDGIIFVETGSHGGYHVCRHLNAKIPEAWQAASFNGLALHGWYEEDSDWCMVALTFPEHFPEGAERAARVAFRHFALRHGLPMLEGV